MSFQQGLSGLNSAAKNLDVIGNNVANAATVGYKGSVAQFSDMFASSLQGSGTAQVGIGTQVSNVAQIFTQGNITVSSNPLDVAINGKGFFRLSDNGSTAFTRTGQFTLDKDGYVVNPAKMRLTGYQANAAGAIDTSTAVDLQLISLDLAPQGTTEATVLVNLDAREANMLASNFDLNNGDTFHHSTSVAVYDTLGNPHSLGLYFLKTAAGAWDVFAAGDGTQIGAGAVGQLTFQTDGQIDYSATTLPFNITLPITTGAAPTLPVAVDFFGTTQFGSDSSVNSLRTDGYGSGRLTGFSIAPDGVIAGRYTNGQTRNLAQILLANFANPQGLQPLGGNLWTETFSSGQPLIGQPSSSTLGVLNSSAVEDSNVDLTQELVNMITAQRVYQANAQTIKTQDQVLQTLVNLR